MNSISRCRPSHQVGLALGQQQQEVDLTPGRVDKVISSTADAAKTLVPTATGLSSSKDVDASTYYTILSFDPAMPTDASSFEICSNKSHRPSPPTSGISVATQCSFEFSEEDDSSVATSRDLKSVGQFYEHRHQNDDAYGRADQPLDLSRKASAEDDNNSGRAGIAERYDQPLDLSVQLAHSYQLLSTTPENTYGDPQRRHESLAEDNVDRRPEAVVEEVDGHQLQTALPTSDEVLNDLPLSASASLDPSSFCVPLIQSVRGGAGESSEALQNNGASHDNDPDDFTKYIDIYEECANSLEPLFDIQVKSVISTNDRHHEKLIPAQLTPGYDIPQGLRLAFVVLKRLDCSHIVDGTINLAEHPSQELQFAPNSRSNGRPRRKAAKKCFCYSSDSDDDQEDYSPLGHCRAKAARSSVKQNKLVAKPRGRPRKKAPEDPNEHASSSDTVSFPTLRSTSDWRKRTRKS